VNVCITNYHYYYIIIIIFRVGREYSIYSIEIGEEGRDRRLQSNKISPEYSKVPIKDDIEIVCQIKG